MLALKIAEAVVTFVPEVNCGFAIFLLVRGLQSYSLLHPAVPPALKKIDMKCLWSEKLNFVGTEGATLIPMADWREFLAL